MKVFLLHSQHNYTSLQYISHCRACVYVYFSCFCLQLGCKFLRVWDSILDHLSIPCSTQDFILCMMSPFILCMI